MYVVQIDVLLNRCCFNVVHIEINLNYPSVISSVHLFPMRETKKPEATAGLLQNNPYDTSLHRGVSRVRRPCRTAQRTSLLGSAPCLSPGTSWLPRAGRRAPCSACPAASPSGPTSPLRPTVTSTGSPFISCPLGAASWRVAPSSVVSTLLDTAGRWPTSWVRHCCPLAWWSLWWVWSWYPSLKKTGSSPPKKGPSLTTGPHYLIYDNNGIKSHKRVEMSWEDCSSTLSRMRNSHK